jgi:hypothetical protein
VSDNELSQIGIEEIIWRVDSKISEVRFVSSSGKDNLKFEYDAMGNRVAKYVIDGQTSFAKHVTYYVRDASGNVMAVYEHDLETPESYHLAERHIYGSSRLGMITEKVEFEYVYGNLPTEELVSTLLIEETVNFELEYSVGKKQYELSNHLGNVLAVISDWKVPVISGASVVSYTTVVVSSQDYSPFGVTLSGRSWSAGYRYGFNGQEKEKEITGSDTHTSAEFWMYDTRVGRRWQLDPKPLFSSSNYSTLLNSPISFFDLKGDTTIFYDINNGSFLGKIDDGSRLNHILINPDVYEEKMGGVAVENFQNDSKCADEMVADLISSAESLEITRNDGFDYIARESEQYLFIGLTGGQGTLEWRVRFDNTAQITIGTWKSQSDNKKGDKRHPAGVFKVDNLRYRTDNNSLIRDGFGFTLDIEDLGNIWDPKLNRNRDYIGESDQIDPTFLV